MGKEPNTLLINILFSLAKILVLLTIIYFIYLAIYTPNVFHLSPPSGEELFGLSLAISSYIVAMSVGALAYMLLIRSLGQKLSISVATSIVFLSQAAKYIPGNVAHHIGRVVLSKRYGLSMTRTFFTMLMETVLIIAIGSLLALLAILFVGDLVFLEIQQIPSWWIFVGLTGGAVLAPLLGKRLFERATRWWSHLKGIDFESLRIPPLRTLLLVGLLYVINYLILGLVLQLIATQIFDTHGGDLILLTGIFAVAWIVGFITPGAPAGLGVREVVLIAAFTPLYSNETAIGIAAVLRVVTVLGDGLAFLIGLGLGRINTSQPEAQ